MNELIFNGKRLSEFGAFYDSHQAFNTPERDLEYVEILGRDGDLIIDNDRFKNIEINFPCYIPTDFLPKYRNLMAYLNSQRGYKRLEYSQEPDYYRLASFAGNVEASPLQLHLAGRFTLPFICKPQRFLKSGEIPVSASSQSVSYEGNPVEIDNPSDISAVSSLAVALEPIQTGSGDPSPTNIRPITGHTSASVTRTGKNFLPSHAVGSTTTNGVTFTANANGTITVNGTATAEAQYAITFSNLTGNYYFSGCPSGGSNTTYELYAWDYTASARFKKWNGATVSDSDFGTENNEINIPSGHNGSLSIRIRSGYTANNLVFKPMIRLASETDATYEPYQGNTYTINLNGTRYGGTVDLVTGVLTVTHGFVTFDGSSDENWTLQTDGRRCAIRLTDCKIVEGIRRTIGAISNLYEEEYPIDTWNSVIGFSIEANGDLVVRQFTTNTMTVADFKAFLQSNPMQICYPLQTPQTVQLTAQQISLLTGINYISSSDEVTVTVTEPSLLENPTLFESKPLIRVYGHGTLAVNNQYITIAENPYAYIDIDCDMMDAFYGANNANQYVTLPNDYITLKSGNNYIAYDGTVEITPRWYEV